MIKNIFLEQKINHNFIHPNFVLNGLKFNIQTIKIFALKCIDSEVNNDVDLGNFILNWINDSDYISLFTSGTTSKGKQIKIKKISLINSALSTALYFKLKSGDKLLCCLPFSYIAGKMMLVRSWVLGLSIDLVTPSSTPLQYTNNQHYDFCSMVPFQVEKSLSKISQIKTLLIGGAPVSKSLALKLVGKESKIYETFGMTETVSHFAVKNLSKGESYFSVLPGISISLDKRNCLMVHAPKLNQEKLITNDVVLLLSSKKFVWVGRYDNIINSGGIKIYPEELEKQIGIQVKPRYFISSIKDITLGQKVVLVIEGKKIKVNLNWGEIEPIKQPKSIFFIDKFIETKSGKIRRQKTLELLNLNQS